MATSRTIKNRIRSTKSIQQITKAMQAVSAVKMRKSESAAITSRPYAISALEILKNIRQAMKEEDLQYSKLTRENKVKKICLVVVTSDKGLAGSFNTNVLKRAQQFIKSHTGEQYDNVKVDIVAVGKRGRDFLKKRGLTIIDEFLGSGDFVTTAETLPISSLLHEQFLKNEYDEVTIIYTNFISAMKQNVVVRKILPVTPKALEEITKHIIPEHGLYAGMPQAVDNAIAPSSRVRQYIYEPSPAIVLDKLIKTLVDIEVHQSILEANASEHSSRMIAMKSASDNAKELIGDLRITYNKVRQAQITKELTEISAGAEALA